MTTGAAAKLWQMNFLPEMFIKQQNIYSTKYKEGIMAHFTFNQKQGQINALIKKYGSKEKCYKALEIGLERAKAANDTVTVEKFLELIGHFDVYYGIFSI